ncbi:MAG: molybdopterin-binding protein [Nitrososphaerales archaeon]
MSEQVAPQRVELLVVGNELLNGTTQDTNSHWLSIKLTSLGFTVDRKTSIRDELSIISAAFRECTGRKPAWIISVGGLGPTFDDKTIEALSNAVKRPLELNSTAVSMLKERYKQRALLYGKKYAKITKASLKMARLPRGAIPLRNSKGSAPGVLVHSRGTRIVLLPGVPREMKSIFLEHVKAMLEGEPGRNVRSEEWLLVKGVSESRLSPFITKLSSAYAPKVYIKSHPFGFKKGESVLKIQLILESQFKDDNPKETLGNVSANLIKSVKHLEGSARRIKSV